MLTPTDVIVLVQGCRGVCVCVCDSSMLPCTHTEYGYDRQDVRHYLKVLKSSEHLIIQQH